MYRKPQADYPQFSKKFLPGLLFLSAVIIAAGALDLRVSGLVPLFLTVLSGFAVAVALLTGIEIRRSGSIKWMLLGEALGIVALATGLDPSHVAALGRIYENPAIAFADISLILGFMVLPILYLFFASVSLYKLYYQKGR
ncbi:hypothetical protein ApAK_04315 [Thermoplasmatales archaeon AK]|nr:hypothetical protein [Thermoplasmatales archaeon AK]